MDMLKRLLAYVHGKVSEFRPKDWIFNHDNVPDHKALSVMRFLAQKSNTEVQYRPYPPDLTHNDFWLFQKIKSALKRRTQ
jgi:hypothetical protein